MATYDLTNVYPSMESLAVNDIINCPYSGSTKQITVPPGKYKLQCWGAKGGSGYVYTSSTASNYPSGCLLNSSYYLTSATTIPGNVSFTSPSGSSETGHTGNGYVRITPSACM